ncbi:hypothetical protein GCM10008938_20630 [Deinococcus roseus]|uniref:Uncharacterized protein n=1 Tax=Deinococcus roseus TaxID=392414 RepID=A0ABQ2CZD5_9DEIO|nr:hypothetical protein GCM10008938_20630 [Deinococcus roseus]
MLSFCTRYTFEPSIASLREPVQFPGKEGAPVLSKKIGVLGFQTEDSLASTTMVCTQIMTELLKTDCKKHTAKISLQKTAGKDLT